MQSGLRLGYTFGVFPSIVEDAIVAGRLTATDGRVVAVMIALGLARGRTDSCWTVKSVVARQLGLSARTVQASWARLRSAGWLVEQFVGRVDTSDPLNRTGRRWVFGWLGGREGRQIPDGEQRVSPGGETIASPNVEGIKQEQTTDPVVVSGASQGGSAEFTPLAEAATHVERVAAGEYSQYESPPSQPPADLPAEVSTAIQSTPLPDALRSRIAALAPRWIGRGEQPGRVARAVHSLSRAISRGVVNSPIGYLVAALRTMAEEGETVAPTAPPRRSPDADETAEKLRRMRAEGREAELEREAAEARWAALPEEVRVQVTRLDEAANPRPPRFPVAFWELSRMPHRLEIAMTGVLDPASRRYQ